jgi:NOL1/NOP2/sun family putative RNA methylase
MLEFLEKKLEEQYGLEIKNQIFQGYEAKRKVTFRVNTLKSSVIEIENILNSLNIKYQKVPWSNEAFIIINSNESDLQKLDIYKQGKIYLQSLSSMLPPIVLNPKEGADILDMAAAPGGKTTQMASLSNNKAHITACEMNNIRIEKLKYNVELQGATCVYIMQKDSRQIDDFFSFDQILLDAPCSGSGTLSTSDENVEKYFTEKLIEKSAKSQLALLKKAIKILKKGQEMVYSTCSILSKENEDIVLKVMSENNLEIVPIEFEGIEELPLLPSKIKGTLVVSPNELYEGFYIAKIRKI